MKLLIGLLFLFFLSFISTTPVCPTGKTYCDQLFRCINATETCQTDCSGSTPYKCSNNGNCVEDPADCCPGSAEMDMFFCYTGVCVNMSSDCPSPGYETNDTCPSSLGHDAKRCPDGRCVACGDDCLLYPDCPIAAPIVCPDRSCTDNYTKCTCPFEPDHYRCTPNGECTPGVESCLNDIYCPGWRPFKCIDGKCVANISQCNSSFVCNTTTHQICADKSCIPLTSQCGDIQGNGCPATNPARCLTGECRPTLEDCPDPYWCRDVETPYKCPSGLCVVNSSSCPITDNEMYQNGEGYCSMDVPYLCAIGICVEDTRLCPAIYDCDCNQTRRADGTCRDPDTDPDGGNDDTCTPIHPYRCLTGPATGMCVDNESQCPVDTGCPEEYPYRCYDGTCVINETNCTYNPGNGCPPDKPYRCPDGQCVTYDLIDTCNSSYACPTDRPYRCPNGTCINSTQYCVGTTCDGYLCASGACVPYRENCTLYPPNGCLDPSYPYLCVDGTCVADSTHCASRIYCPEEDPYLCASGVCVQNYTFCPLYPPCPDIAPYRCWNLYCVINSTMCNTTCPEIYPIRCENGACVSNAVYCPGWNPSYCPAYTCYDGSCAVNPSDCSGGYLPCPNDTYRCWDGRCVDDIYECPTINGCPRDLPKRCLDGSCVNYTDNCNAVNACTNGTIRCPDGSCMEVCGPYNGCPTELPIYCPDFTCTDDIENCMMKCDNGTTNQPLFYCANGTCVADPNDCPIPQPEYNPQCNTYYHDTGISTFNYEVFAQNYTDVKLGYLTGSSGAANQGDAIYICGMPDSYLRNYTSDFSNIISTLFDIKINGNYTEDFKEPVNLGFLYPNSNISSDQIANYCLATINETSGKFVCVSDLTYVSNNESYGQIISPGKYLIIEKSKVNETNCPSGETVCPGTEICVQSQFDCPNLPNPVATNDSFLISFSFYLVLIFLLFFR
ncbi:hypothetical protein M0811_05589 [Anaeramoeba ignava]|uniref:Uncharacterized protein n=1 Tax=Anaeramoeba ignava TaxID=1746090 RepID=A0A9Q0LSU0_ANAIG|nr:hypothetical protein M0811_05589 [Anaeramoeba ignava]